MTQTPPTSGTPTRSSRRTWLRALLFVSLALNLAVIGIVGGTLLSRSERGDRPESMSRELGLGPFLSAMEPGDRQAMYQATRARAAELTAGRSEWRAAFDASLEILRSDPFDVEAMEQQIARQEEAAAGARRLGRDALLDRLSAMSLEARRDFADHLEESLRRGRAGHGEPRKGQGQHR